MSYRSLWILGLVSTVPSFTSAAHAAPCSSTLPFSLDSIQSCTSLLVTGGGTVSNAGTISGGNPSDGSASGASFANTGNISTLTNLPTGIITGGSNGILNLNSSIGTFLNSSGGQILGGSNGIENTGSSAAIGIFNNHGIITGSSAGIFNNDGATITTLTNGSTGVITGDRNYGIYNRDATSSIGAIYNYGTIKWGGSAGINVGIGNEGTIGTVVNSQGAGNANGPLTYQGVLPSNYYVYISSATSYGKLDYYKGSAGAPSLANFNFGIDSNSVLALGTYSGVLKSTNSAYSANGTAFTGTANLLSVNGVTYTLTSSDGGVTYDLNILGLSIATGGSSNITGTQYSGLSGGTLTIDASGSFANSFSLTASATNTIDTNGNNATLSGIISDATAGGTLNFTNSGVGGKVILSGVNTYTGATTVGSGAWLSVNGSIATSSGITVNSGGTLGGTGQLPNTTIASGGVIAPGNSIGTLNVNGSVSFASGSTFQVEANPGGQSDKIVATGSATITGGTVSVVPASGSYNPSTTYTILTAATGVSGTFAGVVSSVPSLRGVLSYDAFNVFLQLLPGPSDSNTARALISNQYALSSLLIQRTSAITAMMEYDCATFDAKGYCVSFRARYTGMDSQNEGAGVLTAAYRANSNFRIGGFIDYRVSEREAKGLKQGDTLPTFGAFAAYSDRGDATGFQAKASAVYNSGKVTVTRAGSVADNTEAGSGTAVLSTYAVGAELGWGVAISPTALATPYAGVRYSDATRNSYTEGTVSGVDFPISYDVYYQRLTTATAGVRLAGMFSDNVGYQASLGGEYDLGHKVATYSGTSTIPGLEGFALANTGSSNRVRVVASTGVYYQLDKTQRLTATVGVRGQAFSSQTSVMTLIGYQAAF